MKLYEKPQIEEISLIAKEAITGNTLYDADDGLIDGEVGVESSEFD